MAAQHAAMKALLQNIVRNMPQTETQPKDVWEWAMWIAGMQARDLLAEIEAEAQAAADNLNTQGSA